MGNEEKRLFIGIPPSRFVLEAAEKVRKGWNGRFSPRWVPPGNLHLTVCFIGETTKDPHQEIIPTIQRIVTDLSPFEMEFDSFSPAPPKKPYMIWAVYKPNISFERIFQAATSAFIPEKGTRDPIPHITLARAPRGKLIREKDIPEIPSPGTFHVNELVLWRSELHPDGARYFEEGRVPLSPGG